MKKLLIHILTVVFLVASCCVAGAQEQAYDSLDAELARYESLCQMCLELRERVKQGEDVTKNEAEVFISRFLATNKSLKQREEEMTLAQRLRFAAIGQWFSSGEKPVRYGSVLQETLPMPDMPLCQSLPVQIDDLSIKAQEIKNYDPVSRSIMIMAGLNVPDVAYGLSIGYIHDKWGGYLNFKSNYVFSQVSYSCMSGGYISDGGRFWANGQECKSNLIVSAGGLYEIKDWLSGYLGAGYGWRTLAWQDVDGNWAEVQDWSVRGVAVETGLVFSWKQFIGTVGVSTISFKTCSLTIGLGYKFSL